MQLQPILQLAVLIGLLALMLVALFALIVVLRRRPGRTGLSPKVQALVDDARYDEHEQAASLVAEQIEEMVRSELAQYPDLANVILDFGTMPNGTLDIWVGGQQYDDVKDIPDERIRRAIQGAVEEFNRRAKT